jgi:hypothetical protein
MTALIEQHRGAIAELCRRYGVAMLDVFGSAVGDDFDPSRSDVDFLVEFLPMEPEVLADAYFGLLFQLEDLLGCEIDLVCAAAMRNPYFIQSVQQTRTQLYAA